MTPDELSIALTDYVEDQLTRRYGTDITGQDEKIRREILEILRQRTRSQSGPEIGAAYIQRVAEVVAERLPQGRDAPKLRILPVPIPPTALSGTKLGLLFAAETVYFQDTVLALQTDEALSRREGEPSIHVLGVRADWLTSDHRGAQRALRVDDDGYVKEVAFREPLRLDAVQVLHLPRATEQPLHGQLSAACERCGMEQLNPYDTARRADDKSWTHRLWAKHGIPSPAYGSIPRRSGPEQILVALAEFVGRFRPAALVLQPNAGTEGVGVERFRIEASRAAAQYAEALVATDDVLVREARGNVRFRSEAEEDRGYRPVTLRIHVAWDGQAFVAESGYVQAAENEETFVASRGRGGDIVEVGRAFSDLWRQRGRGWERLVLTSAETERIGGVAVEAVEALHADLDSSAYLKLVGVDILLEVGEEGLIPIALEANPRPAGLAQSTDLCSGEPKISFALFEYLRAQREYSKGEQA